MGKFSLNLLIALATRAGRPMMQAFGGGPNCRNFIGRVSNLI